MCLLLRTCSILISPIKHTTVTVTNVVAEMWLWHVVCGNKPVSAADQEFRINIASCCEYRNGLAEFDVRNKGEMRRKTINYTYIHMSH
jgi:hypothetical protein